MAVTTLTIDDVNRMDRDGFVATFADVYESTPALATVAWRDHPFADRAALVTAFRTAADELDEPGVLALLRAHPQLAAAEPMTTDSRAEQRAAGLTDLDDETRARIVSANARYVAQYGFPFILAVRGLGPADIAAALDARIGRDAVAERATALAQVQRIAALRIDQLVVQ